MKGSFPSLIQLIPMFRGIVLKLINANVDKNRKLLWLASNRRRNVHSRGKVNIYLVTKIDVNNIPIKYNIYLQSRITYVKLSQSIFTLP